MALPRLCIRRIYGLAASHQHRSLYVASKKAPPVVSSYKALPCISISRGISQEEFAAEEAKQTHWGQLIWNRIDKTIKKYIMHEPQNPRSEEETREREEFYYKIQSLYYQKNPKDPGKAHFIEAFDLLMKWDDWRGVEDLWDFAEFQKVEFDDDTIDKIEDYLIDARKRAWREDI